MNILDVILGRQPAKEEKSLAQMEAEIDVIAKNNASEYAIAMSEADRAWRRIEFRRRMAAEYEKRRAKFAGYAVRGLLKK